MEFKEIININVNEYTEKKGNLTYLSWAWAWTEFKKIFPSAEYTVKKDENNLPYFASELGIIVYTTVTADEQTYEMWLPVMDNRNNAKKLENATMMDINKTIMRCLTKNLAMFGLGLYIYAGEDLPESEQEPFKAPTAEQIAELTTFNGSLDKLAVYLKKEVAEVSFDEVEQMLIKSRKRAEAKQ